jgi:MHS family shikimate/dehydroshikimate transporter-like MFS transporter
MSSKPVVWRAAGASFIGTMVEWYDYYLYGTAAALVFNKLFFPTFDPLVGVLLAFASFSVGFIARPLGGLVFGHFGDKLGRKSMLVITLVLMGVSTTLIGVLPTYAAVGVWAPILLVTLRVIQGFGVGGEFGGAVTIVVEHSPERRRGFFASLVASGNACGLMLATGIFALVATMPEEQFLTWGWRVPFLLSVTLLGVGLYIRLRVAESPSFQAAKTNQATHRMPIVEAFRTHPRSILVAIGMRLCENSYGYIAVTFSLAYLASERDMPTTVGLVGVVLASGISVVVWPLFGALSDRVGRRPVFLTGAALALVSGYPFFLLLDSDAPVLVWLAIIMGWTLITGLMTAPIPVFFSELFDVRVRYTGLSIGYQLGSIIAGGIAPLIATALIAGSGGDPLPVVVYIGVIALISFVAAFVTTETHRGRLPGDETAPEPGRAEVAG